MVPEVRRRGSGAIKVPERFRGVPRLERGWERLAGRWLVCFELDDSYIKYGKDMVSQR